MTRIEARSGREVAPQVNAFYRTVGGQGPIRPSDLLFLAYGVEDRLVGCVRFAQELEIHVLRSLLVDPEWRGQGVGHDLVARVLTHAEEGGVQALFCLSYPHLEVFYRSFGFETVTGNDIPQPLDTRMLSYGLHGIDAICMRRPFRVSRTRTADDSP